ncbi:hypothetical protein D9611_012344 [Ephemerocybe angulata]|uniref:(2E,6E)-farnesyl diphosphate synthase n=1 Tax=Ephemerocybe angulata TaxID=980116 RepID=A0A8H5FKF2_9AGAR|nr:hypothetical protein D9611_012344 [Tulosesus angulatus]
MTPPGSTFQSCSVFPLNDLPLSNRSPLLPHLSLLILFSRFIYHFPPFNILSLSILALRFAFFVPHASLSTLRSPLSSPTLTHSPPQKHFRKESYYADLLDIFHDTAYKTEFGQLVDLITAPEDHVDLSKFSLERHRLIVIYKTAFYSFYLPVACAMLMSGVPYPEDAPSFSLAGTSLAPAEIAGSAATATEATTAAPSDPYSLALSILIPLGEYFQVQDDFLDFSATPEVLGKIGTDIVDNKCSWVVNTALLLTSPTALSNPFNPSTTPERLREIRQILEENYGKKEKDVQGVNQAELRVKEVYEELGVRKAYEKYEERVVGVLRERIAAVKDREGGLKKEVFTSFLGKIYKRSK